MTCFLLGLLLATARFSAVFSVRCYWCSGVGDNRECEKTPSDVSSGPVFVNCRTKYCISAKVMDAHSGQVRSFARLCASIPRGNACIRDTRLITCFETCTTDFCNQGNPDPAILGTKPYSEIFLGLPPISPLMSRDFLVTKRANLEPSNSTSTARPLVMVKGRLKKRLKGRNEKVKEWRMEPTRISPAEGNMKMPSFDYSRAYHSHSQGFKFHPTGKKNSKRWYQRKQPEYYYENDDNIHSSPNPSLPDENFPGNPQPTHPRISPTYERSRSRDMTMTSPLLTIKSTPVPNKTDGIEINQYVTSGVFPYQIRQPSSSTFVSSHDKRQIPEKDFLYEEFPIDAMRPELLANIRKGEKYSGISINSDKTDVHPLASNSNVHIVHIKDPDDNVEIPDMVKSSLVHFLRVNDNGKSLKIPSDDKFILSLSDHYKKLSTSTTTQNNRKLYNQNQNRYNHNYESESFKGKNYISKSTKATICNVLGREKISRLKEIFVTRSGTELERQLCAGLQNKKEKRKEKIERSNSISGTVADASSDQIAEVNTRSTTTQRAIFEESLGEQSINFNKERSIFSRDISLLPSIKVKERFINPNINGKLINPNVKEKFINPNIKERFINPNIKDKFINPNIKDKLINPNIEDKFINPNIKDKFINPNIKDKRINPNIKDRLINPNIKDKFINPNIKEKFITTNIEDKFINPNIKDKLINPNIKGELINPNIKDNFINPNIEENFINPNIKDNFINPNIKDNFINPNIEEKEININITATTYKDSSNDRLELSNIKIENPNGRSSVSNYTDISQRIEHWQQSSSLEHEKSIEEKPITTTAETEILVRRISSSGIPDRSQIHVFKSQDETTSNLQRSTRGNPIDFDRQMRNEPNQQTTSADLDRNVADNDRVEWRKDLLISHGLSTNSTPTTKDKENPEQRKLPEEGPIANAWKKLSLLESANGSNSSPSTFNGNSSRLDVNGIHMPSEIEKTHKDENSNNRTLDKPINAKTKTETYPVDTEKQTASTKTNMSDVLSLYQITSDLPHLSPPNLSLDIVKFFTSSQPIISHVTNKEQSAFVHPPRGSRKRYPVPSVFIDPHGTQLPRKWKGENSSEPNHRSQWLPLVIVVSLGFKFLVN